MSSEIICPANESEDGIVRILWTGGWDSTYRMVELSQMQTKVLPIYCFGDDRPSEQYERKAMDSILTALRKRAETKAELLPVKFVRIQDIPADDKITEAYKKINADTGLGSQHEYLARLAAMYPGIELGHELGTSGVGHMTMALKNWCHVEPDPKGGYRYDKDKSTKEGNLVLGNFTYPIMDKTETDMAENIKKWGYEDVMKLIWFCHKPIGGIPCGICHPCQVKVGSGMSFLMPEASLKRYRQYHRLKRLFGEEKSIRIIRKLNANK